MNLSLVAFKEVTRRQGGGPAGVYEHVEETDAAAKKIGI
jgi:hypothetical protein